jgi:hypothetical protein
MPFFIPELDSILKSGLIDIFDAQFFGKPYYCKLKLKLKYMNKKSCFTTIALLRK